MEDKDFRAKQFMPFDALKGFYDLIDEENIIVNSKKDLSEDMNIQLNSKLKDISKNDEVIIKHYHNIDYVETVGKINKIDYLYKKIYIMNSVIDFEDILNIKKV